MALGTVLARNLVHAALFLVAFFFVIACQFVLLEAEFLAAVQVLIYIGAVAILLLFGIMLTRNIQGDETTTARWPARLPAAVVGLGVLFVLVYGIAQETGVRGQPAWSAIARRPPIPEGDPKSLPPRNAAVNDMGRTVGTEMMTRYVIAFEVAGLLLTAALVGAVALAQLPGVDEPPSTSAGTTANASSSKGSGNGHAPTKPEALLTSTSSAPR
jgi:NADH-quinone oxidoreductase subunit J